jgi:hypothetical protein
VPQVAEANLLSCDPQLSNLATPILPGQMITCSDTKRNKNYMDAKDRGHLWQKKNVTPAKPPCLDAVAGIIT